MEGHMVMTHRPVGRVRPTIIGSTISVLVQSAILFALNFLADRPFLIFLSTHSGDRAYAQFTPQFISEYLLPLNVMIGLGILVQIAYAVFKERRETVALDMGGNLLSAVVCYAIASSGVVILTSNSVSLPGIEGIAGGNIGLGSLFYLFGFISLLVCALRGVRLLQLTGGER
jgi:hypothetical protein